MTRIFLILIFTFYLLPAVTTCLYSVAPGIDVGNKSIDFSLKVLSSTETFELSNYKGKKSVLVVFFATWCSYCTQEIPTLNRIYNEYGHKRLQIVAINIRENEKKIASFVKRKKILYPIAVDTKAEVAEKFKVYGIPTNILINTSGIIVFRGSDLPADKVIEKTLPKPEKKNRR
ncbi:MAG: TlpA disulfide reductase family protein [Elusimicrobiota bacterium]